LQTIRWLPIIRCQFWTPYLYQTFEGLHITVKGWK
jgi:hypothetical protein